MITRILLLLFCLLPISYCQYSPNLAWTPFPSSSPVDQISAKSDNEIYSVIAGLINRWNGTAWTPMKKPLTTSKFAQVSASVDGWTWALTTNGSVHRWNVNKTRWDSISGASLKQIGSASKDKAIGVDKDGTVWEYVGGPWRQRKLKTNSTWATIAVDGEKWMVDGQGKTWRWTKETWTLQSSKPPMKTVEVYNQGRVIGLDKDGLVHKWNGTAWVKVDGVLSGPVGQLNVERPPEVVQAENAAKGTPAPGKAVQGGASPGKNVKGTTSSGKGTQGANPPGKGTKGGKGSPAPKKAVLQPNPDDDSVQSIAITGTKIYAISNSSLIPQWAYLLEIYPVNPPMAASAVSARGNELWIISSNDSKPMRWHSGGRWEQQSTTKMKAIAATSDGSVWAVDKETGDALRSDSGSAIGAFKEVPAPKTGKLVEICAASSKSALALSGSVVQEWDGKTWQQLDFQHPIDIGMGVDGEKWATFRDKTVRRWQSGEWRVRATLLTGKIDVYNATRVALVSESGQLHKWNGTVFEKLGVEARDCSINGDVIFFTREDNGNVAYIEV